MFNQSLISEFKQKAEKAIELTKQEIATIRTGKASPALVENFIVNTYQGTTKLKLKQLATISTQGPFDLVISPFDPSVIKDIEKALLKSNLNLTPIIEEKNIRLKIPPLSLEQRKNFLKIIAQKIEQGREKIRLARDEIRKKIKTSSENKELSEEERFRMEKEIDKITQEINNRIEEIKNKKEKELMEI